ncbi:MAG: hypothetical protein AMXMBFR6_05970 [Betaproteobacteria bacterium]
MVDELSQAAIGQKTLFERLKETGSLPTPKGVGLAIVRATQKEASSVGDIARIARTDPAFSARLLKAANGAVRHLRRPVVAVPDAITVLGVSAVRNLALGLSLLAHYRDGPCKRFDYRLFWTKSLIRALSMQVLAEHIRLAGGEESFCVGLLAKIGELALATAFPKDFDEVLEAHGRSPFPDRMVAEHARFAISNPTLTAAMLVDWSIPKVFVEPVRGFEDPEANGFAKGSREESVRLILRLSEAVAHYVSHGPDESARNIVRDQVLAAGNEMALDMSVLTQLVERVGADWQDWARLLELPAESVPAFEAETVVVATEGDSGDTLVEPIVEPLKILVVDDDATMRTVLARVLTKFGHEARTASDGHGGIELAMSWRPGLMIVDWVMPQMGGADLVRAVRQSKDGRGVYIIVLTGIEEEDRLVEAFEAGVDDFLTKPIKPRVLAARIRAGQRVIRLQHELEREHEATRRIAEELELSNRRLREVALTDPLTGFRNRRFAMERLVQEWAASLRSERPLACLMIDVDAFKVINDSYGHDVGDRMLKHAAQALKKGLRTQDVVCRIGGDEFLVICPDTGLAAATACAERVRALVAAEPMAAGRLQLAVSISVGVAQRTADMTDPDMLLKAADQGLYRAKKLGRNRVAYVQVL